MPILFQYLLKVSICLAIVYIFYQLVLRRLTFYNHNRWYLFGYSILSYFIALINIGPILSENADDGYALLKMMPSLDSLSTVSVSASVAEDGAGWSAWHWLSIVMAAGVVLLALRLFIQLRSYQRIKAGAKLVSEDGVRFYQVNGSIIPFSFGNSIYVNQRLHTSDELKEIIRHEFVHVRQRHTVDIIWSELLCILNWYNPFAWLIKKAMRQNLEFIADNKVISDGIDKKKYQYLLLKVIGNNHFSIASQFNFTSLKKRIIMMNKIKTAKVHLLKFLFILPLLAVILVAFRNAPARQSQDVQAYETTDYETLFTAALSDTVPGKLNKLEKAKAPLPPAAPDITAPVAPARPPAAVETTSSDVAPARPPVPAGTISPVTPAQPPAPVKTTRPVINIVQRVSMDTSEKPLIIVAGEEWPSHLDINLIDASRINKLEVLKGESATSKYGNKGKNGVILIDIKPGGTEMKVRSGVELSQPVFYLNGKKVTRQAIELIDPVKIKSVDVLKGEKAVDKYGDEGKNGVIEIAIPQPAGTIRQVKKPVTHAWDIQKIVESGKKKDNC